MGVRERGRGRERERDRDRDRDRERDFHSFEFRPTTLRLKVLGVEIFFTHLFSRRQWRYKAYELG